jgi:GGDEF domain-containing protein
MLKDTGYNMRFTPEPTDRDGDLTLDVASIPPEMAGLLDAGLPSFTATAFFQFLRSEVARANRYNFLVSLLLLRILPTPESKCTTERERLAELSYLLNASLRTTDYLGSLGDGLVGVIAPHSDLDTAARLLQRLQAQSLFSVFRRRTGCDLRAAFSVYPTDATTITSLFQIALERMR